MDSAPAGSSSVFKRLLLWDYSRESSAYGVVVGLILAFIFLTPRDFFRDQPKPKTIVQVSGTHGSDEFWISPEQLAGVAEKDRLEAALRMVRSQPGGKDRNVVRVEPIYDVEKDLLGYMVYTRP